jgi:hypothetical protein
MMKLPIRRSLWVFGGGAALAILAGSIAFAAIPGPDGTISACYKEANGQVRIVNANSLCDPSEVSLSWNQQGPQGIQGIQGLQGIPGPSLAGPSGAGVSATVFSQTCADVTVLELPVVLTRPATIQAYGSVPMVAFFDEYAELSFQLDAELVSGATVVARLEGSRVWAQVKDEDRDFFVMADDSVLAGPLLDGSSVYTVPTGSHTLRFVMNHLHGSCGDESQVSGGNMLSYQAFYQ